MDNKGSGTGAFLLGVGVGAGLMAILDPGRGAWRRSYLRDKVVQGIHIAQRQGRGLLIEIGNEVRGSVAEQRARMREGRIPNAKLVERVRAQVGHVVQNFGALDVSASDGHVTIWGPVLRGEKEKIEQRLRETRGVRSSYVQVTEYDDLSQITGSLGQQPANPTKAVDFQEHAS